MQRRLGRLSSRAPNRRMKPSSKQRLAMYTISASSIGTVRMSPHTKRTASWVSMEELSKEIRNGKERSGTG